MNPALLREINAGLGEAFSIFLQGRGPEYHVREDGWLAISGEEINWLNLAAITDSKKSQARFQEWFEILRHRHLGAQFLLSEESTRQLAAEIAEKNLKYLGPYPLMSLQTEKSFPADFASGHSILCAREDRELEDAAKLLAQVHHLPLECVQRIFGRPMIDSPGTALYLLYDGLRVLSMVWIYRRENTVGIHSMATLKEFQRKGLGRKILLHAMNEQIRSGADFFYLLSSPEGMKLYRSLGFEIDRFFTLWELNPS